MRRLAFLGTISVLLAVLLIQACTTREVVGVVVSAVSVTPRTASLIEGDSLDFDAAVMDDRGAEIDAAVEWASDDTLRLSVGADGIARALGPGTVTVRATFHGVSGTATVTVIPAPHIDLSPPTVSFFGGEGDASPAPVSVAVANSGGGTLGGLSVGVQFAPGEPTDWLTASLAGTSAPTTLRLTPQTSALTVGSYSATVAVSSPDDRDGPVLLNVSLTLAGLTVSESGGSTVVTEGGSSDDLTVVLGSQPASDVVLSVTSGDPGEASVSTSTLTFTPASWSVPQLVTVTGVQDAVADGDITTTITVSVDDAASDDTFDGLADRSVSVTTTDDDVAGITVAPTNGLATTEAGATAQFTIVLDTEPTAPVTIALSSSDTGEGTVSPPSVQFTALNWNVAQNVQVTGQNDAIDDGDVGFTIVTAPATSTDPGYAGLDAADVSVTNADDADTAGIIVAPTSGLVTTETGGQTTFTMVLTSQPTANVTIALSSSDPTEGTVSSASRTFTSLNWNVAQTVTIASQDDGVADGNVVYTVVTSPATSADPNYLGFDAADVSVTNVDDETAGITVSPATGPTTEAGGQATFTVVLNNEPSAPVTIALSSSDVTEGTLSATSLTFTSLNWSAAQTVTVTGQDDALADGDIIYTVVTAPASSGDQSYNGVNAVDVSVTNVDDEAAGIVVSPPTGPTTEAGGQATFTVVLTSEPTADVTIGLSSTNPSEGTVSATSLTFTIANWNAGQTVTVTGQNDALADGNVTYAVVTDPATSGDAKYDGLDAADVSITNVDDETAGITVSPVNRPTTEAGGAAQFTVVLNTQPTANVTIGIASSDTGEGTVSTGSLTFTTANWNAAQTVTVTGQNDDVDDGNVAYTIVTAPATSADASYAGLDAGDVSVTNNDDDVAGVSVSPSGLVTTEAGGQATFTVVLTSEPTANVTLDLSSSDIAEGTISAGSLTFTSLNWNTAQSVTVTGQDDALADGNVVYTIVTTAATSADSDYAGLNAADILVTNVDNETAGITVSPASGPTTETGGQATFTVALNNEPTASVTIALTSSDTSEGTLSTTSLLFTSLNWNLGQTVTVTGQDDDVDDDNVVYTIVTAGATSTDPNYGGLDAADVSVTNIDDETAGISVSPVSGPTTEAGGTATFSVALTSEPTADVAIALTSSDTGEGTVSTALVTFTSLDWNVAQIVTVTGQDDAQADGNVAYSIVSAPATSADPKYSNLTVADVSVTNIDDETAGITVTPASAPTTEVGGTATFTVVLNTEPAADVSIALTSSDTGEGTVSTGLLTFTSLDWSVAQTVTVTGENDDVDDGNVPYIIVTAAAASADPTYAGIDPADVSVTNVDDETAGITVSSATGPTTESGGTATFAVVLTSEPTADVTLGLVSSDPTEGRISVASLTFTSLDWSIAQTVTVTGRNDALADGNIDYTIVTQPATSADTKYNNLNAANVALTNIDDETAGITVSPASGPTTEAGGTAQFTVVLNTEPTADVTIGISSTDTSEGTVSVSSLTFRPLDWSVAQTVVVTGEPDDVDDDNVVYIVLTDPAVSVDPNYAGRAATDVTVTNVDDDVAGFSVSPASGPTSESGAAATFTVVLTSEPTADVTVALASSDPTEGTASPSSVTFTSLNWSAAQSVTLTGQDDDLDDGDVGYSIVTQAASSSDPKYDNATVPDVSVTNVDDESAGITVSSASGPTTEAGAQATFSVVLTSEPTADVTIGLSSSDPGEGTLSTSSLTFTSLNWSALQTVTVTGQDDALADGNVGYSVMTAAAVSADPGYSGLDAADVPVTNVDDETAGATVSAATRPTSETGGQATFTVVLNNEPTADVTIALSSSDTGEGTLSASSLTFTGLNWSVAQTVTVTGQDDDLDDGDVAYSIITAPAVSTDPDYSALDAPDVAVTNVDDDAAGVTVSPASGPTTEAGGQATFTVVLTSEPTGDVTIPLSSSDTSEGIVSAASLTFTALDWDAAQMVTVTGQNDATADGNFAYTIVTGLASSTDFAYDGLDAADVALTNIDDETVGITVSPASAPTTEAGGQATFTVVLSTQPAADVTIPLSSSNPGEGVISTGSLTFTDLNWNLPQAVTVTGQDDDVDDGDVAYQIVTAAATSADSDYSGIDPDDVSITNIDDDGAGIVVSPASGPTTEAGGQATFTVVLSTQPSDDVSIAITSSDTTEGLVSTGSLTFTTLTWSVAQTITITGQDDALADGNVGYTIVTALATSLDPDYSGLNAQDVSVTNVDDETAGVTVSPASGPTTEAGDQATFTVVLNAEPTADVTIAISSSDPSEGTVSTGLLTFTNLDWNAAQTVTVTGQNDDVDDDNVVYTVITAPAGSTDPNYSGLVAADVLVTNVDDDVASITVSPASGPTTESGGTATFGVVLTSEPTADVTIALSSSDASEGTVSTGSLTFTSLTWDVAQTVTVTGQDDAFADGNVAYTIVTTATSGDQDYDGLEAADVSVTNVDDETAGITVSPASGPTTEAGGTASFTVVLSTQPSADVSIALSSSDTSEGTASTGSLTFTDLDWNVAQTVTVTGQDDDFDDGDIGYTISTAAAVSSDPNYSGLDPADVLVTNNDDDDAGISVSPASGPTTEAGGQATFSIVLTSEPEADVTIGLSSSDTSEGTISTGSLTFTNVDWDVAQTVTVTGQDDAVADGNVVYAIVTAAAVSTDPGYSGLNAADVSVTNVDDETPGITVTSASGPTTEVAGTATFTVVLNTEPSADVTIGLSSSDTSEGTISTSSLTFTSLNWSVARTVTVTGQNDDIDDGNVVYSIVTAAAASADPDYATLNAADVPVTNVDDDVAGITVSAASGPTTEGGGQATFTVVLDSQPTADVTIGISSGDASEGTVSTDSLTFTDENWNVAQTVTVTGENDALDDGNVVYAIVTAAAASADLKYANLNAADVSVTNVDDETAGITVSPASGPTTEAGDSVTFTVVLNSQPTADVTIGISSSDTSEGTVSSSSLTFTTVSWNAAQSVTVTGQDDDIDDGNIAYVIVTAAATSTDQSYNGIDAVDVAVTNIDDETAGVSASPASGPTTEAGGTATLSVVLDSEPTADVTIGLSSSDTSEGTIASSSLTFTPSTWNVPQVVIVTGQDDEIDDDNVVFAIVTAAASSTDASYDGLDGPDVSVTNVDDADLAGVTVAPTSGLVTTEAGGTATFDVVLTSEPIATVSITLSVPDATEGTVTIPADLSLEFTSLNWSTPQPVTVRGINDAIDDDNQPYTIVTAASSSDGKYNGITVADVSATNNDDTDTAGVIVNPASGLVTTEAAGTATFSVALTSEPLADVTITVQSNDATEGTASPSPLVFTAANWSLAQTVTVTGANDDIDDGNVPYTIATAAAASGDPKYSLIAVADVSVTNNDDADTAGVTVSPTSGLVTTEAGGQDSITVVLTSEPTDSVTIIISSADPSEGGVDQPTLTFTPANWDSVRTVTVTGQDDDIDDGDLLYTIQTGQASSSDLTYNGISPSDVSVTNVDDDTAGLTILEFGGTTTVTELAGPASIDSFTVVLDTEPTSNVVVAVASGDTGEATVSPTPLTFTSATWATPQTVTVTGVDDDLIDGSQVTTVTISVDDASSDDVYDPLSETVAVTTTSEDVPGFSVLESGGATQVTEAPGAGNTDTFTVELTAEPASNVVLSVVSSDTDEAAVSTSALTFTPANWDSTRTVTVTGVDDAIDDDTQPSLVTVSVVDGSSDDDWDAVADQTVNVTTDDDDPPPDVSVTDTAVTEGDAGTVSATFTVTLSHASAQTVTVQYATSAGTATAGTDYTAALDMVTFVPGDVSEPIMVLVQGDVLDEANETFDLTLSSPSNAAIADSLGVGTITDDDPPPALAIGDRTVTELDLETEVAEFVVTLSAASGQTVTVSYTTSDSTAVAGADYTLTSGTLTFNPGVIADTIQVPVLGDFLDEVNERFKVTLSGPANATIADALGVGTITDDDISGFTITQSGGTTTAAEGGPGDAIMVVLTAQPTSNVVLTITSANATDVLVDGLAVSTVTFSSADWDTAQAVAVTAFDDVVSEAPHSTTVTFSVDDLLSDDTFDPVPDQVVSVAVTDNDP